MAMTSEWTSRHVDFLTCAHPIWSGTPEPGTEVHSPCSGLEWARGPIL